MEIDESTHVGLYLGAVRTHTTVRLLHFYELAI